MPTPAPTIILLAASARAMVQSACRAGFSPHALDQFGDVDTRENAASWHPTPTTADADLPPAAFLDALCRVRRTLRLPREHHVPVIVGGGLESWFPLLLPTAANATSKRAEDPNHPKHNALTNTGLRWLGPDADTIRLVRDPAFLKKLAADSHARFPASRSTSPPFPRTVSWLQKQKFSAAGLHVSKLPTATCGSEIPTAAPDPWDRYWQQRVSGRSLGATLLITNDSWKVLGVCRSLLAHFARPTNAASSTVAPAFLYGGSIGPWPVTQQTERALCQLASNLQRQTTLRGLVGIDLIEPRRTNAASETPPWLLEINPRYCSSVEVLEMANNTSFFADHVAALEQACTTGHDEAPNTPSGSFASPALPAETSRSTACELPPETPRVIKFVFWTRCGFEFSLALMDRLARQHGFRPDDIMWCDQPAADEPIPAGAPVITAIVRTTVPGRILARLRRMQRELP